MARSKTVAHGTCVTTGKRSFASEFEADKALGRAQAKRKGQRGVRVETRHYYCVYCDGHHLTGMSRREFANAVTV